MKFGKRKLRLRAAIATMAAGAAFQVSSCSIDEGGLINASADPLALADIRVQLFEQSPLGRIFDHWHGGEGEGAE